MNLNGKGNEKERDAMQKTQHTEHSARLAVITHYAFETVHYTCYAPIIVTTSTMTYTYSAFKFSKYTDYWQCVCVCVCGRYSKNWIYYFLGPFSLRSHFLIERNKHCPPGSCFHFKSCCIRNNSNDIHFAIFDLHIRTSHIS